MSHFFQSIQTLFLGSVRLCVYFLQGAPFVFVRTLIAKEARKEGGGGGGRGGKKGGGRKAGLILKSCIIHCVLCFVSSSSFRVQGSWVKAGPFVFVTSLNPCFYRVACRQPSNDVFQIQFAGEDECRHRVLSFQYSFCSPPPFPFPTSLKAKPA